MIKFRTIQIQGRWETRGLQRGKWTRSSAGNKGPSNNAKGWLKGEKGWDTKGGQRVLEKCMGREKVWGGQTEGGRLVTH